jgi:predicted MFS family arabinose efflux permease
MVASIGGNMPGRALAVNQIVASVTTALTMLLGGRLIGDDKYDMIFPVCGLLSAACALLFFVITKRIKDADGERVVSIFRLRREDVRGLLASSFPVIIVLGVFAEPLGFHAINQLFPNLARDVHGMSEFRISAVVALGRLPALASLFILAHYIDRLVPGIYYGLGIAIAGIAVVLMGSAGSVPVLLCGYILFYVGQGTVWGSNSAAVNSVVQARLRDSAYAVMSVCMYGSVFAIGSLHNMMIRHEYSLAMVFKACGMAAVASGAALAVYSAVSRSRK